MEIESTISTKGQVVIPKSIRKRLGLRAGEEITFDIEDSRVIIKKKTEAEKFLEDFLNVPRKLRKPLRIEEVERMMDEEYELP